MKRFWKLAQKQWFEGINIDMLILPLKSENIS